ncbi:MAG: Eco57I restriction-modification methylase domain-containing protein [Gammaproteobacteria bacterium]|nr:Eco57I restriction-modification methylase domain-containing protein [Gammaproteobacteria bacterium]
MATVMQDASYLLERTDAARQALCKNLPKMEKHGQYFTSMPVASLMASMMDYPQRDIRILDPGAGVGSLFTACVQRICGMGRRPDSIQVVAYEIDDRFCADIDGSLKNARDACRSLGIKFTGDLVNGDFIRDYAGSSDVLSGGFTHVIMNPPYKKINVSSHTYGRLLRVGLQTTNMYSAFIAISRNLLDSCGQMTFISPRSFCNGTYFYPFRRDLLESVSLRQIHLFGSRTQAFSDYGVLQENVILSTKRNGTNREITVSSSSGPSEAITRRRVRKSDVVFDEDPLMFIHIVADEDGARISRDMRALPCTLADLGMDVSTGKVVDFRISGELRFSDEKGAVPLIRPLNIADGITRFPVEHKKHCNFIMANKRSRKLLVDNGSYVLVKRFTTVEQRKRVTASVWTPDEYGADLVGFENRINYFHSGGAGLPTNIARGLWVFLNSSPVDAYFRQFNGSTQVNAADLRYLRYPTRRQLAALGRSAQPGAGQDRIDGLVEGLLSRQVDT